ncbi:MAG TPA: hypothetical protein VI636_05850 [Candidatus Angelobacter sp.]
MATSNVTSPTKAQVYESLFLICQATQQIIDHLERLRSAAILPPVSVELHKMAANQLRAAVTATAVLNLAAPEAEDAYRNEKRRIRMETRLARIKPKTKSRKK